MIHKPVLSSLSTPTHSTAEQVRAVALNLFAEQGFERVSIRELAAAIKVKPGSLYNHIESKQSLLYDLIEEHESGLLNTISRHRNLSRTPCIDLTIYVESYITFQLHNPKTAALARLELRSLSPDQQKTISGIRTCYLQHFAQALSSFAKNDAANSLEISMAAHGILEMLNGLASAFSIPSRPNEAHQLIERIKTLAYGAISGYFPCEPSNPPLYKQPLSANSYCRKAND